MVLIFMYLLLPSKRYYLSKLFGETHGLQAFLTVKTFLSWKWVKSRLTQINWYLFSYFLSYWQTSDNYIFNWIDLSHQRPFIYFKNIPMQLHLNLQLQLHVNKPMIKYLPYFSYNKYIPESYILQQTLSHIIFLSLDFHLSTWHSKMAYLKEDCIITKIAKLMFSFK